MRVVTVCSACLSATVLVAALPVSIPSRHTASAVVLASAQQAVTSTTGVASLVGRVVSDADRAPVALALVTVHAGRMSATTRTDPDGRFDVLIPGVGDYTVAISRNGFVRTSRPASVLRTASGAIEVPLVHAAAVTGRVVDAAGRSIVSVRVRIVSRDDPKATATRVTDDRGVFRIGGLAPGRYTVNTEGRPEYQNALPTVGHGTTVAEGASSNTVSVDARSGVESDVTLTHRDPAVILPYAEVGAAISGRVVDEFGLPVEGVSVQLRGAREGQLPTYLERAEGARLTDDRGEYRLFHVPAGRYLLTVADNSSGSEGLGSGWLPVYYPGTSAIRDARMLEVGRREELAGIDVVFTRNRGGRVFGLLASGSREPLQGVRLTTVAAGTSRSVPARTVTVDAGGAFEFSAVPPGDYVLRATTSSTPVLADRGPVALPGATPAPPQEFALARISVTEGDLGPVVLTMRQTASLSGQVVLEGANANELPPTTSFQLGAVPAGDGMSMSEYLNHLVGDVITPQRLVVRINGLGGTMRFRLLSPAGWWLKSATIGGSDAAERPVTFSSERDSRDDAMFVLSNSAGRLSGTLPEARKDGGFEGLVLAFSTDRDRWYAGSAFVIGSLPTEDGRFVFNTVPPGSYLVAAVTGILTMPGDDATTVELLDALSLNARRVTVGDRQQVTLSQRLTVVTR